MFKTDQPISSFDEDILGRSSFSKSIGKAILSYKDKNSIAIGLFGAWGSGKTSIINMAVEHIESEAKEKPNNEKPIIIRFNPWNYSDQNQLISQFFRQMSVALKKEDHAKNAKEAGKQLKTYAKFFDTLALFPVVSPYAEQASKVFKNVGSAAEDWGKTKSKDLDSIKTDLNKLLAKQNHKIIVIIDDIDRLNNTEIRQVFQLVKSLGDFSNTIYLLAFDKNVIINALKKVQAGSGEEYLEKVIQIPFEIPLIPKQEVEQLLFNQLNEIIDEIIEDIPKNRLDQTYWNNIYHSGLKYFFNNIRDVNRYVNSVRFGFELVREEVNTVDFLAITGIQIFIPEVFCGIRDNKDIFTGIADSNYRNDNVAKEQAKKRCDEIIGRTNELSHDVLKEFLTRLFPKLKTIYGNSDYGHEFLTKWRRDCRVCSPDIFDIFFRFSLPKGEISQKEIETILLIGNNFESFTEALLKLNEDGRIIRFIERFEDYTHDDIPTENIETIVTGLMNISDSFPEGDSGFLSIDTSMKILHIFYQLLHRFDNHEKRFMILKNAIERANNSLYIIVREVVLLDQQHGRYDSTKIAEPEEELTVNSEQLTELEKIACGKIENWAGDGRLKTHRNLLFILYRWKEWGHENQVDKFAKDMIESNDGLIDFIASFLSKSTSIQGSDYVGRIAWKINRESLEKFINLEEIEPRIREIMLSSNFNNLEDRKKLALNTFIDTIDGRNGDY
jgi:predicted KAP-like P-loop ATPase